MVVSSVVLLAVLLFSVGQGAADGDDETPVSIFHPSYLILAAGIFTAFIAGDLFNLYVGFEILLVASYVLITLGSTENRIRTGVVYIVVSLVSSILFLAAIAVIYGALGTVNMAQIADRMTELPQETQTVLHLLLLLAFSIKAAVFPLSFWLPDSYPTAPAPVTAVFAGLLTKVGVYAMIRTETQLFRDNDLNLLLLIVALATMIVGVLGAVAQAELKRILSFTLVSHVGYMVFGLAIATPLSIGGDDLLHGPPHRGADHPLPRGGARSSAEPAARPSSASRDSCARRRSSRCCTSSPRSTWAGCRRSRDSSESTRCSTPPPRSERPIMMVLIVGGIVTSLLTLYALMRAWNLAFWREEDDSAETEARISYLGDAPAAAIETEKRVIPRIMTAATGGMVAITVALTIFAGPLYDVCARIGGGSARAGQRLAARRGGEPMTAPPAGTADDLGGKRGLLTQLWRQLPFFVWLIALWMLLWGQFTVVAFVTGVVVAVFVTQVFRLPPVELSGRLNLWYGLVFVVTFFLALIRGSLLVAWQVIDPRALPGSSIIAVQLRTDDDLIMTHTGVTASLIPGSLIIEADRDRRILYLHVLGATTDEQVAHQKRAILGWEARIVRAVGSREQLEIIREREDRHSEAGGSPRMNALLIVIYVVFTIAALLTLWRIVVGPSILDRAVASDVLLTEIMCVLGAEMAINNHTRSLPVLLIIAAVGVFGSISIARFVARRENVEQ